MTRRLHIDSFVAVQGIDNYGAEQPAWVCLGKPPIAIAAPLHWSTYTIPITQENVVTHPDLITVIKNRTSRQGEQEAME